MEPKVRPAEEIAARFLSLSLLFTWVCADDEEAPSAELQATIEENGLDHFLTDDELDLLEMERDEAGEEGRATIGWKLENMWPLAWALGFAREPAADGQMIDEATVKELIFEFTPKLVEAMAEGGEGPRLRGADELAATHARFAAGDAANPVIVERTVPLAWMLAPGTEWEDHEAAPDA